MREHVRRAKAGAAKNRVRRASPSRQGAAKAAPLRTAAPRVVNDALTSSSGHALDAATRAFFEPRFGHDFSGVRVHCGTEAAKAAAMIDAFAYTAQSDIVLGAGFSPVTANGRALLAHELAHVVQNRNTGGNRSSTMSRPGDGAETRADAAARAVLSGRPAPSVGGADSTIQRAVKTNGGSFDAPVFTTLGGGQTGIVGAAIDLEFTANDLVESSKIGLIQTVKATKTVPKDKSSETISDTSTGSADESKLITDAKSKDPGREIDVPIHTADGDKHRDEASTSPIYGVGYGSANQKSLGEGKPTSTLTVTTPTSTPGVNTNTVYASQWGSHEKDPATKAFKPALPARLTDVPKRSFTSGETHLMSFEVAAMAVEGPIAPGTFLGSVNWGWQSDAAGAVTLNQPALSQPGIPSAGFLDAAKNWNAAEFKDDKTGAAAPSVDIPLPTVAYEMNADRATKSELKKRIDYLNKVIPTLAPESPDLANKQFEKTALENALKKKR